MRLGIISASAHKLSQTGHICTLHQGKLKKEYSIIKARELPKNSSIFETSSVIGLAFVAFFITSCDKTPRYETRWENSSLNYSDATLIITKCDLFAEDKKSLWLSQNPLEKSTHSDYGFRDFANSVADSNRKSKAMKIYRNNLSVCLQESGLTPVKVCISNCE